MPQEQINIWTFWMKGENIFLLILSKCVRNCLIRHVNVNTDDVKILYKNSRKQSAKAAVLIVSLSITQLNYSRGKCLTRYVSDAYISVLQSH